MHSNLDRCNLFMPIWSGLVWWVKFENMRNHKVFNNGGVTTENLILWHGHGYTNMWWFCFLLCTMEYKPWSLYFQVSRICGSSCKPGLGLIFGVGSYPTATMGALYWGAKLGFNADFVGANLGGWFLILYVIAGTF